ncbi:hypothetical protein niasHT_019451 [Heterodera trifolii]|uniref:peptidyl-tRNA hydrolase n=1 Tax=Heterodera trifolii TaxID=157864 RepID=A0ABD2KW17_9BILA
MEPTDSNSIGDSVPQKMVFVVNTALKMGPGKMAAQVGHAAIDVYKLALLSEEGRRAVENWERHGQTKIVLRSDGSVDQLTELFQHAQQMGLAAGLIHDEGRTQVPPGSCTILGIFGSCVEVNKVTGHLRLHK